jgi:hypothetical protein
MVVCSPPLHLVELIGVVWDSYRFVNFVCWPAGAGVCALGAVVEKHAEDEATVTRYLNSFKKVIG